MKQIFQLAHGPLVLDLPNPPEGMSFPVSHPLNYYFNAREKQQTIRYLDNVYDMAKTLPQGQDVVELFGGIGVFPTMLWPLLKPKSWVSVDIDPTNEPYYLLRDNPDARFQVGNAYSFAVPPTAGIVYIDIGTGSLQSIGRNLDGRRPMYDQFLTNRVPHVMLTDVGYYWCHLKNHHPWYEQTFGAIPHKGNYAQLWDKWFKDNLGYQVVDERHGGGCQLFHMVPHSK